MSGPTHPLEAWARPGAVLGGRYELTERLATGGMGQVWRATDQVLHRPVAVKVLKDELADSSLFLERFRSEARNAASLTHPSIASVHDYAEDDGCAYLVMELVDGEPLSATLAHDHALAPRLALSILAQAAEALGAAHDAGIVHRDVKPGNIILRRDGTVKLTDFGIARASDSVAITEAGSVLGTAQYMSPEQADGRPATPASDIYSLGVVGYEMLAGHLPFVASSPGALALAHLHNAPPPLPESVPDAARRIVERALAKDPARRYASAREVATQARDELAQLSVEPAPATTVEQIDGREAWTAVVAPSAAEGQATHVQPPTDAPQQHIVIRHDRFRHRWRHSRRAVVLAMGAVLAVILLVVAMHTRGSAALLRASAAGASTTTTTTPAPTTTSAVATAATAVVDPAAYVGHPLADATTMLQRLGFTVVTARERGAPPSGTVTRVDPTGVQPVGSTITLFVSDGSAHHGKHKGG